MKFGLRWIDLLAALLGVVLCGALDRFWHHASWPATLRTMGLLFVFLCALYIWVNRRRADGEAPDRPDQRVGR